LGRELASFGYCFITVEHLDGSSTYTKKANGEEMFFNTEKKFSDFKRSKQERDIRVDEMKALVDEI